ncbi:MAG TPA: CvpA family protein [Verrucomicrobiae bacterium]|nr:CvpA family protein [Verrucomicrobiae bacterium]
MNFKVPFNWFDMALIALLVAGIFRGRKRGMSVEFLTVLKWLFVVFGASALYQPLGDVIYSSNIFSQLFSYIVAYLGIGLVILGLFALFSRSLGGKLLGSDFFGSAEYPLGMTAGLIRVACVIVAVLALLNARAFTPAEIKAEQKYQNDNYGSDFFPTLHSVQSDVFERSLTGPWIKKNLGFVLIKPTVMVQKGLRRQTAFR